MIAAILDTNVLATGLVSRETSPSLLMNAWRAGLFHLIISEHILTELTRTLAKDYFSQRLARRNLTPTQAIALLRDEAIETPITATVSGVATHPEDDFILATAISGKARYLVTGDKQLCKLGSFRGVTILSPADFLNILTAPYETAA
jgi:putative PIN family toxin of toxin-antitoxin system